MTKDEHLFTNNKIWVLATTSNIHINNKFINIWLKVIYHDHEHISVLILSKFPRNLSVELYNNYQLIELFLKIYECA